jgi:putative endonuclease
VNNRGSKWYVYIIECEDKSLYVGVTTCIKRRFFEHQAGKGSKFIRSRKAKRLVYTEECHDKYAAFKREREIKGYSRQKKLNLLK